MTRFIYLLHSDVRDKQLVSGGRDVFRSDSDSQTPGLWLDVLMRLLNAPSECQRTDGVVGSQQRLRSLPAERVRRL